MSRDEFITLIESIGFKHNKIYDYYEYKEFSIELFNDYFDFWDDIVCIRFISFNNLEHIKNCFKKELRTIKLKQLLGEPRL